jgi:predicted SAM-dependent methyltransferase
MKKIQFGAGSLNIEGWLNLEQADADITKPLPFADGDVDAVFAEMVCEHVTPREAWSFLDECHRILKPGGLIRIVIPDFVRCWRLKDPEWLKVNQGVTQNDGSLKQQMKSILFCHGHQGLWTAELLQAVMESIGFSQVLIWEAGVSGKLPDGMEQHYRSVGKQVAWAESGCVEGVR